MEDFCGLKKGELIYLASPLGTEKVLQEVRAARAATLTVALLLKGFQVYGPTTYGMALVKHDKRMEEFDWLGWDLFMLGFCTKLAVFQQDGWIESTGVLKEIICALENDMPICYIPEIALRNLLTSMDQERLERKMVGRTVRQGGVDVVPCSEALRDAKPGELIRMTQEEHDAMLAEKRENWRNRGMPVSAQEVYIEKPILHDPNEPTKNG